MKTQILNILNKGGAHIPIVSEWMEIAKIVEKSRMVYYYVCFHEIMQRFEELTRGKFTEIHTSTNKYKFQFVGEKVWQPALLEKEMFICEKPTDESIPFYGGDMQIYNQEKEKVWFEWIGIGNAVDYSEITEKDNISVWEFVKLADRTGNWKFTENFVNDLLK